MVKNYFLLILFFFLSLTAFSQPSTLINSRNEKVSVFKYDNVDVNIDKKKSKGSLAIYYNNNRKFASFVLKYDNNKFLVKGLNYFECEKKAASFTLLKEGGSISDYSVLITAYNIGAIIIMRDAKSDMTVGITSRDKELDKSLIKWLFETLRPINLKD